MLGQARGKVGDIVFSRSNGQQIVRSRSAQVRNPQTEAQVLQRILMNTVAQAYSKMIAIVDHSVEGLKVGQDTMSAFMSRNLNTLRSRVASHKQRYGSLSGLYSFSPIGSKVFALNPYIMSVGSLPAVNVSSLDMSTVGSEMALVDVPGAPVELSYEAIISAFGLQRGDQLTFCQVTYVEGDQLGFEFCRVILDPMNPDGTNAPIDEPFIVDGSINLPNERNNGNFARLSYANGALRFSVAGGVPVGVCVIVSRQDTDGKWMRSSTILQIVSDPQAYDQTSLLDAIDAFYTGGISFESPYYLNNAEMASSLNNSSEPAAKIPYFGQFTINDVSALSADAAKIEIDGGDYVAAGSINNFKAGEVYKLIVTTRTLNIDSIYGQDTSADNVINLPERNFSVSGTLTIQDEVMNTYLVAGGMVIRKYRSVGVQAVPQTLQIASLTVAGSDLLSPSSTVEVSGNYNGTGRLNMDPGDHEIKLQINTTTIKSITTRDFSFTTSSVGQFHLKVDGYVVQDCGTTSSGA